jgi:phosphopantetheinyl transferase
MQSPDSESAPRVVLHLDSVAARVVHADQAGWTDEEHARLDGISDRNRRAQYQVGHWRIRGLASVVFGGTPGDWRWSRPSGEPARLLDDGRGLSCYGSISHAADHVACVVSDDVVGLDIEILRAERELAALARRCLAPDEAEAVAGLEGEAQGAVFYRGWAIREALGKAAGTGLVPNIARKMAITPAGPEDATLRVWTPPGLVLALAHGLGARIDAHLPWQVAPENFAWNLI